MDPDPSTSTRIAVLIDSDNVSSQYASAIFEELAKYGTLTFKRAYGDWTDPHLKGWQQKLLDNAIQPVQQFAYAKGKNATDSALIIDAMDLLWQGNVDAFALVSSDSDFTRLATRLRESGKHVYGLGRKNTLPSLRQGVNQFIELELLEESEQLDASSAPSADATDETGADTTQTSGQEASPADTNDRKVLADLQSKLTKAVNGSLGDNGWSNLSALMQHLQRTNPDFDSRTYHHRKLVTLVEDQPYLETKRTGTAVLVRTKQGARKAASAKSPAKKTTAKKATTKPSTKS